MDTPLSSLEALDREEVDLAVKLAGFLRPSTLYPGSYPRVQAALVELLEGCRGFLVRHAEATLRVAEELLELEGRAYRPDHPDLAWMADFFREALLEGVVLERGGSYQGFLSFSGRLVESRNLALQGTWPADFWNASLPGIRPLPLRDPAPILAALARSRGDSSEPGAGSPEGLEPEPSRSAAPGESETLGILASCDGIQERLQEAARLLPGLTDPAQILAELLPLLPGGGGSSPATVLGMVDQILERVLPVLTSLQPISWEADQELIRAAFGRVASRLFAPDPAPLPVEAPAAREPAPEPPPAEPEVEEDPQALLALWAALPAQGVPDLLAGARADALTARLEAILAASDEPGALREAALLGRSLSEPEPEEMEIWRVFLGPILDSFGQAGADPAGGRLLSAIRHAGRAGLFRRAGTLDLPALRKGFPWLFPLFVEALDSSNPEEVRALQRFCAELGPRRILGESRFLASSEGILPSRCGNKILAMPGRPLVPFVLILLRFRGAMYHQAAASFLARAGLDLPEAAPFCFYARPEDLPLDYLTRLCEAELAGKASRELSQAAAGLLQRFIEGSAEDPDLAHQRTEAVRSLKAFPFFETERFLQELARGSGFLGFKRPPGELRQACREALEELARKKVQP